MPNTPAADEGSGEGTGNSARHLSWPGGWRESPSGSRYGVCGYGWADHAGIPESGMTLQQIADKLTSDRNGPRRKMDTHSRQEYFGSSEVAANHQVKRHSRVSSG
jgi:hypothetical protein